MKKRIIPLIFTSLLLISCSDVSSSSSTTKEEVEMKEILQDSAFETGFDLMTTSTTNGRALSAYLDYNGEAKDKDQPHPWQMSQWWTPFDFKDASFKKNDDGTYEYENESRHIKVDSKNKELTLDLDSNAEYQKLFGHSRNGDENWSHILIEQNIKDAPKISQLKNIYVNLEFSINKAENMDPHQAVPAAQFLWYFTITDPKNGDTAYESEPNGKRNQFMWFGLPLFDSRYDFVDAYTHADTGFVGATNTVIYSISNRNYLTEKIQFGKRYTVALDILPYIKEAYLYGFQQGAMENCEYSDLVLNYMNLGWELPGSYKASATIKNLSTKIVYKEKK